jgi:hypothetical protein
MTPELFIANSFIANIQQGGGPMIAVFLAIALVGGIVYLVRGRRGFDRDRASDRNPDARDRINEQ